MNNREDGFEMGAGGNFGDNTAVGGENVDLGNYDVTQDGVAVFNDGGGSFVAR